MVRPGRLDKFLYVDLPGSDERAEILMTMTRKLPLGDSSGLGSEVEGGDSRERVKIQLLELVKSQKCDGYSGADLAALVREAGVAALRRTLGAFDVVDSTSQMETTSQVEGEGEIVVCLEDFVRGLDKVPPSVSAAQRRKYETLRSKLSGLPVRDGKDKGEEKATI